MIVQLRHTGPQFTMWIVRHGGVSARTTATMFVVLASMLSASLGDYPPPYADDSGYYSAHPKRSSSTPGCTSMPANLTLCRGVGYSSLRLPNLFGHQTLDETIEQASNWVPLLNIQCHPDTQIFLCSLFAPVCLEQPVYPCRTLCDAVKAGCEDSMLSYGYPWPDILRCDRFPDNTDVCIKPRRTTNSGTIQPCPACSQPYTYEAIIDAYCNAQFAMKVTVVQGIVSGADLKFITAAKRKLYKTSPLIKMRQLRTWTLYVLNGATCDCPGVEQLIDRQPHQPLHQSHRHQPSSRPGQLLAMGRRDDENDEAHRLIVTRIIPFNRRSRELRRAVRDIRRRGDAICRRRFTPTGPNTELHATPHNAGSEQRNTRQSGKTAPNRRGGHRRRQKT